MAADDDPFVARELQRLDELAILEDGELVCEVELAVKGSHPGALVVTSERVLFLSTTALGRKTRVDAIPLRDIEEATSADARWLGRSKGVVTFVRSEDTGAEEIAFERVRSAARGAEIASTIMRQRRTTAWLAET